MAEALKTMLYTPAFFDSLAAAIQTVYPEVDTPAFITSIHNEHWNTLELKQRMRHTSVTVRNFLPDDYRAALSILLKVAPTLDRYGFERIFFSDFVEQYGLHDWEASLPALESFTQAASAEFAVRPFIIQDQTRMLAQMQQWAQHESAHVRRLASEGCRPRLPWAMALPTLKKDPTPILPILEHLKHDPSEDVRRSVANNLNDIAKDNPQVVIDTVRRWHAESSSPETQALIRHALRTLIKAGNPDALALLGYGDQAAVVIKNLMVEPAVIDMHGSVTFSFEVESAADAPQDLMVDYILHLAGANGKTRTKVFKLAKVTLGPGETIRLSKPHSFKPITTRRYYPGAHAIEIQINGKGCGRVEFEVR
jgi:3-methyladenine DNA glycosylase AlkC